MIKLGIIGFGGICRNMHVPAINESGRFFIKAVADPFASEELAKEKNIPCFYKDYKEMLKDPEIDAILISSPHDCHEEHAVASFNAGKHVLLEKPIAINLKQAKNIIDAWQNSKKVGMLGFSQRFRPLNVFVREQIKNNMLGKVLSARIDHYQRFKVSPQSWWRSVEKSGGGAVIGSGIHRLDMLRWCFGEPISVYAKTTYMPDRLEGEACAHAVIEFDSGVIANFSINWACDDYMCRESFSVTGDKGSIFTDGVSTGKISLADVNNGKFSDFSPSPCPTMYDCFADCIEKEQTLDSNLLEGYKTLRLIRAIYKSAQTGTVINPETIDF